MLPVPNLDAPVIDPKTGRLSTPWNSFFQQFTQAPEEIVKLDHNGVFLNYTAETPGNLLVIGASSSQIILTRGNLSLTLPFTEGFVPLSISDSVNIQTGPTANVYFITD